MPDTRLVAIPDTDGELVLWLDRLEELLITLSPLPGDPEDWEPPAPPLGDGSALAALQRLSVAVHAAERTEPPALIAPNGRFELVPLRFVRVDPADIARVADGLAALGRATLAGGDQLVADALADHAHHHRLAVAEFVAGCTRAHAVLDQPSNNDDADLLVGLHWHSEERIVLNTVENAAYQRVTDEHLAVFHLDDPLARFVHRGPSGA
jgi:hypothetical protein